MLRIVSATAGDPLWAEVERASIRFSFPLYAVDTFRGRLHIVADPAYTEGGTPMINLSLITRRVVDQSESLDEAFQACHWESVRAFAAVTTPEMHEHWGRK